MTKQNRERKLKLKSKVNKLKKSVKQKDIWWQEKKTKNIFFPLSENF